MPSESPVVVAGCEHRQRGPVGLVAAGLLVALVAAALTLFLPTQPAGAHAGLVQTTPVNDQVLSAPPSEVRLRFNESVDPGLGGISVFDPAGDRVDIGRVNLDQGGTLLVVPIAAAPRGTHTVSWRVVSADGHTVSGAFVFHVGVRTGAAVDIEASDPSLVVAEWLARLLTIGSLMLLVGSLWIGGPHGLTALSPIERRASLGLGIGAALTLWTRSADATGRALWDAGGGLIRFVGETFAGAVDLVRVVVAVALVVAVRRAWRHAAMALSFVTMSTLPLSGHAWSASPRAVAVIADGLHVAAASLWVGGVSVLVLALTRGPADAPDLVATVGTASRGFLVAAPVVIITGAVSTTLHIDGPSDLVETPWGWGVVAKLALAGVALALGFVNRRRLVRGIEAGLGAVRSLRAEAGVFAVVVAVTAAVVSMVPAGVALDRPFSERRSTAAGFVQLDVSPARGGLNDLHLSFQLDATTDRPVDAVRVEISSETVEPRVVPVQMDGASHASAMAVSFGPPGTWLVEVTSVYRGEPDSATFEVKLR